MPNTTTAARTDTCEKCGARLTHLLHLHVLDDHAEFLHMAPFSCPKCGHAGMVAEAGRRIVRVDTKAYLEPLGR
jgi:hypothetical protein